MSGLFISFEGLDKAGKSTQIQHLAESLRQLGYKVVVTREPGGTPLCEELRQLVMDYRKENISDKSELLLFGASRAQLLQELILPELQAGSIVLCDRFADSTTAYQGWGRGMDLEMIESLHQMVVGENWPQLTILLDLSVAASRSRRDEMGSRGEAVSDRFEDEKERFYQRVAQGFLEIARQNPQRVRVVDACRQIPEIAAEILSLVTPLLPKKES